MTLPLAVLEPGGDAATALYIVSFVLFILGVRRGTHPTTAKQGNLIAAGGMAIAVATTLLLDGIGIWVICTRREAITPTAATRSRSTP